MAGFKDYKDSPFLPYILPIIPFGAALSETSKLTPERIGKIPGVLTPKGWTGFGDFTKHTSTNAMMDGFAAFYKPPQVETVGMLTQDYICLDCDVDDAVYAKVIDDIAVML